MKSLVELLSITVFSLLSLLLLLLLLLFFVSSSNAEYWVVYGCCTLSCGCYYYCCYCHCFYHFFLCLSFRLVYICVWLDAGADVASVVVAAVVVVVVDVNAHFCSHWLVWCGFYSTCFSQPFHVAWFYRTQTHVHTPFFLPLDAIYSPFITHPHTRKHTLTLAKHRHVNTHTSIGKWKQKPIQ